MATSAERREGTIADAFTSLSGQKLKPLEPRFSAVKSQLINGQQDAVVASWNRLSKDLAKEISVIWGMGSKAISEIDFKDIDRAPDSFKSEHRKRGVAVIRGVIPEEETLNMKDDLQAYIKANPQTKGTVAFDSCER